MSDKQTPQDQPAQNVTELPKKRSFDYKKIAKHVGFGVAAVAAAVVIFKLASAPDYSEQPDAFADEPAAEDQQVA